MHRKSHPVILFLLVLTAFSSPAKGADSKWTASWTTHPTAPLREPLVLHFRHALRLDARPSRYVVHVSADNRFILYVNGHRVGDGPARGDLAHWRYETFDLAPYLAAGANLVSATVWNFGIYAPVAQITDRTAFLLQGDSSLEAELNTPTGWMVELEAGQIPTPRKAEGFYAYMANGPGEELTAAKYDWGWNDPDAAGSGWVAAASPMRENIYPTAARAGLAGDLVTGQFQPAVCLNLRLDPAAVQVGLVDDQHRGDVLDRGRRPVPVHQEPVGSGFGGHDDGEPVDVGRDRLGAAASIDPLDHVAARFHRLDRRAVGVRQLLPSDPVAADEAQFAPHQSAPQGDGARLHQGAAPVAGEHDSRAAHAARFVRSATISSSQSKDMP